MNMKICEDFSQTKKKFRDDIVKYKIALPKYNSLIGNEKVKKKKKLKLPIKGLIFLNIIFIILIF